MSREGQSGAKGNLLLLMVPFFSVFPALLLLLGAISDGAKRWCLGDGNSVLELLKSGRKWCFLVIGAEALGIVLILAITVLAAKALKKRRASGVWMDFVKMAAIPLAVVGLFGGLMIKSEIVPLHRNVQADIKQIAAGELEELTVYFLAGRSATHLPGAYDAEKNLVRGTVLTSEGESLTVYVPEAFAFEPEVEYQTSQDMEWNAENATQYRIVRTSTMGLVTEAPVKVS